MGENEHLCYVCGGMSHRKEGVAFVSPAYLSLGNIWRMWARSEVNRRPGLWRTALGKRGQTSDLASLRAGFLLRDSVICP